MANFKKIYVTQDDCGHWYIIPYKLKDEFIGYISQISDNDEDYELQNEFEEKFGEYRTGGDINLTELYTKEDEPED